MGEDVRAVKTALRAELLQRVKVQPPEERLRRSQLITAQVIQSPAFQQARVILGYSALPYEVDTSTILDTVLARGKCVALPRVVPASRTLVAYAIRDRQHDVEPGPYGVPQPAARPERLTSLDTVDLVIVPGVGFDREGRRLGHGQGYYDDLLRRLPKDAPRIGLAFACQIVERLPVTSRDEPVTAVVSA